MRNERVRSLGNDNGSRIHAYRVCRLYHTFTNAAMVSDSPILYLDKKWQFVMRSKTMADTPQTKGENEMKKFVVSGRMRRALKEGLNYSESFRYVDEAENEKQAIENRRNDLEQIGWKVTAIDAEEQTA